MFNQFNILALWLHPIVVVLWISLDTSNQMIVESFLSRFFWRENHERQNAAEYTELIIHMKYALFSWAIDSPFSDMALALFPIDAFAVRSVARKDYIKIVVHNVAPHAPNNFDAFNVFHLLRYGMACACFSV